MIVFGNAIAQNLVNLQRKHPNVPGRSMVDFSVPSRADKDAIVPPS